MLIAVGLLVLRFTRTDKWQLFGGIAACAGLAIGGIVAMSVVPYFFRLRSAYVHGQSTVIEGTVHNFRPAPKFGRPTEGFAVGDVTLSYDAMEDTPCFNNRPPFRGLVHDGMNVRIFYNNGCIQQIDIQK